VARKLTQLNRVRELRELAIPPGNRLEALRGTRRGQHSIRINDQLSTGSAAAPSWSAGRRWGGSELRTIDLAGQVQEDVRFMLQRANEFGLGEDHQLLQK
jgi:hypothetical protein